MKRVLLYTDDATKKWLEKVAKKNNMKVTLLCDYLIKTHMKEKVVVTKEQIEMTKLLRIKGDKKNITTILVP